MTDVMTRFLALFVIVAITSWASAYPIVRIALHDLAPVPLAAVRYAIAAVLALAWLAWKRPPVPALEDMPRIVACGLTGITFYNILFNCGEVTVSAGAASLIISAVPLMAALLAVLFLGERMLLWGWLGSVVSFGGIALIVKGEAGGLSLGSGAVLVFGAAVCGALYTILQKPLIRRYGALVAIAYILITGALCLGPWLPQGLAEFVHATRAGQIATLELGIFPAAIGYAAWAFVIGHLGAARGAALLYLLSPTTFVLAFLLTGEIPTVRTLVGGAVVLVGVALATFYGRSRSMASARA